MKAAAGNESERGPVNSVDRGLNQTLRKVTGLLGVGRILGRKESSEGPSSSDRRDSGADDSGTSGSQSQGVGPSLTESKSFASDGSDSTSTGEICAPSPSYPFDTSVQGSSSENGRPTTGGRATDAARVARFKKLLAAPVVDVDALRELAWSGVPPFLRPTVWRLLLQKPSRRTKSPYKRGQEAYGRKLHLKLAFGRCAAPYCSLCYQFSLTATSKPKKCKSKWECNMTRVWVKGYASPNADRREAALARKRQEYLDCIPQYYDILDADRSEDENVMLHQIGVDVPRTLPEVPFFQNTVIQSTLIRILYIWAIRHPASGYVQGINDLATPFIVVFLSEYLENDLDSWDLTKLSTDIMSKMEADTFWCLSKLLDGIQDHYTFAQPGIQRLVFRFKELVRRIDEPVAKHLEQEGLEFLQFSFRWLNCLLIREIPFQLVGRLWDTWLSEADNFPEYLVYVCASFLLTWSDQLQQHDFQEMVLFLQHLPTKNWTHQELEMVLSRAFMWRVMFDRSPSHLNSG